MPSLGTLTKVLYIAKIPLCQLVEANKYISFSSVIVRAPFSATLNTTHVVSIVSSFANIHFIFKAAHFYSQQFQISFEKCSLRPRSSPDKSPPSPLESKVSAASPRRIIRVGDRTAAIRAELEKGRRQSLDAILHDTGEKVKEMFQGVNLS